MLAPIQKLLRKAADPGSRRGTVLLLVLGSLALVLILAVVYAALGKGDRRTARTTQERKSAVDNIEAIADHIAGVFATDVFNVVPEITDSEVLGEIYNTNTPIMRREAVDMPVTDYFFTSVPGYLLSGDPLAEGQNQNLINLLRFTPDGGHSADVIWDDLISDVNEFDIFNVDPRTASDPFLASTRPVDLGGNNLPLDTPPYLRNLDWAQISNFAPDGRFVNLYYLRDNFGAPSLDLTRDPGSNNARLTLFDRDGNPTEYLPFSDMLSAGGTLGARREEADWNKPMHWTMYQRRLFRPVNDPAFDSSLPMGDPSTEDYWAYQYADADGDGILDSRWFELVDYTNPTRPVSLVGESDMRFFVAARAIDLSSLVNVATATDFLAPSTTGYRVGSGPEDISLFKLLIFSEHTLVNSLPGEIDTVNGGIDYDEAFVTTEGNASDYQIFNLQHAQALGRKSYLRLADGRNQGSVRPFGEVPALDASGDYDLEPNPDLALSNDIRDYTIYPEPEMRVDYTAAVGSVYPGVSAGGNSRTAPYSIDDLVELLTFHGINDDRNFSKLEQALSAVNTPVIPQTSYSLLRSASPTTKDAWPPSNLPQEPTVIKYMRSAVDIRRMLTTVSGSRPLRSSILDLGDYAKLSENVDRKLILESLVLDDGEYPNNDDGDTIDDVRQDQSRLIRNAFGIYLSTLAPDLQAEDWDQSDTARYDQTKTQYYGHMGPELAVRIAGHLALNFRDMADAPFIDGVLGTATPDGVPDVASVLDLDLSNTTELDAYNRRVDEPSVAVMRLATDWDPINAPTPNGIMEELWEAGLRLDIDDLYGGNPGDFIADDGQNVSHHAMILYGVEPQPFLSQVSSMTMYADVTRGIGGSDDELGSNPENGEWQPSALNSTRGPDDLPGTIDDTDGLPSIDGEVVSTNDDFVFQAIFFQLFNPFDVPVVLDNYYIEFADSFYPFSDGTSGPVILQPRSTLVVWASNPGDPAEIDLRLTNAGVSFPPFGSGSGSAFEQMLASQLGTDVDVLALPKRFSPGGLTTPGNIPEVLPGDVNDLFYADPSVASDVNRVALLWRDAADYEVPTGSPSLTGLIDWTSSTLNVANRATDQLVDRLRDSSSFKAQRAIGTGSPTRPALDRRLALPERPGPNGEATIKNALRGNAIHRAAFDAYPDNGGINYNSRKLGVALWGSISRRDDASYESANTPTEYYTDNLMTSPSGVNHAGRVYVAGTPVGALPAKVFEPSAHAGAGSYDPYTGSTFLDHDMDVAGDDTDVFPEALDLLLDFSPSDPTPYPTITTTDVSAFWQDLQNGLRNPDFFANLGTPVFGRETTIGLSTNMPPNLNTGIGDYEGENFIKVTVNQTEFRDLLSGRRTLRVGDMLLPLSVGAYRTPLEPGYTGAPATPDGQYSQNVVQRLEQYEAQWTTLGEALAAACGYSDSVGPGGGVNSLGPKDPFRSLSFDHSAGLPVGVPKTEKYVLDRGQLRLDAFVPFLDRIPGNNLVDGIDSFLENEDIRRGLGIPMALNIFDIAQAGIDNGIAALGSIERPVMGTINANTAEPEVLRLHPALAMDMFRASGATPANSLWWPRTLWQTTENQQTYRLNLFEDKTDVSNEVTFADVGSTIAAYRDPARYTRLSMGNPFGGGGLAEVDNFQRVERVTNRPEFGLGINRSNAEVEAIRPLPGFGSIGELFAVRDLTDDAVQHQMGGFARDTRSLGVGFIDRTGTPASNNNYGRGIDFYNSITTAKINQLRNGEIEIATFGNQLTGDQLGLAANYGAAPPPAALNAFPGLGDLLPIMPDQIPDSYDEQLVQLNAVLNSMSVRSDYFAVWFIVQGFKESDAEDLEPTDPLEPSFKARYLMILDRSNVTEKGDRPNVLAFVQLPMLPDPSTAGD
jgi:hypothetical protein